MSFSNTPYKRIWRPNTQGFSEDYVEHPKYAQNMYSFIHALSLVEKDLKELFDFISPNDSNKLVFSHRIYELFFRCCTEIENNAIAILRENLYSLPNNPKINIDYFKINSVLRLHDYEVRLNFWDNQPLVLKPFATWNSAAYQPLKWYQDYNSVKHDRTNNFHLANLDNLLSSAGGLLIILFSQFGTQCFSPYSHVGVSSTNGNFESTIGSLLEIKPPQYTAADSYDFDWNSISGASDPFTTFAF